MAFDFSVMVALMPISFTQSPSVQAIHAASSIAVAVFVVSSNTCQGIPPRILKHLRHLLFASGNNGAIVSNSVDPSWHVKDLRHRRFPEIIHHFLVWGG